MISFDKTRRVTLDSETGEYLKVVLQHHSVPEITFELSNEQGKALLIADLINESRNIKTSQGTKFLQRWLLIKAWQPSLNRPYESPTNFEVSQILIDRLAIFLEKQMETSSPFASDPREFEFVDGRFGRVQPQPPDLRWFRID